MAESGNGFGKGLTVKMSKLPKGRGGGPSFLASSLPFLPAPQEGPSQCAGCSGNAVLAHLGACPLLHNLLTGHPLPEADTAGLSVTAVIRPVSIWFTDPSFVQELSSRMTRKGSSSTIARSEP